MTEPRVLVVVNKINATEPFLLTAKALKQIFSGHRFTVCDLLFRAASIITRIHQKPVASPDHQVICTVAITIGHKNDIIRGSVGKHLFRSYSIMSQINEIGILPTND